MDSQPTRPWTESGQDPVLLNAALRGDTTALLKLLYTHRLPLWRACLAITRHMGEAELLFQETLAYATRNLRAAPASRPMLPWLVKLARQLDASRMRGKPLRPTVGTRRPNGEPWLAGARGAHYVEDEQRALHAYSLLHSEDQWLLTLRLLERLPYGEIARITGISVPRVMNRIALAREYIDHVRDAEDRAA
ncbi:MAG: sigma factor-like helix-turn-helix DNA-binding protein [Candidatus Eisenbacteria bacterium]